MQVTTFFEYIKRTKTLPEGNVFYFFAQSSSYPLLFFYHLLTFFKKNGQMIQALNCATDVATIKAMLSTMSFTGQIIYWLEDFHELSDKKQHELFKYFNSYDGPHRILLFSDKNTESVVKTEHELTIIELPKDVTPQDFAKIRFLVSNHLPDKSDFAANIGMYADYLSLDTLCLFAHYELVLGKSTDEFFTHWMTRIIDPTSSLFVLSQHFFSKKTKPFFRQWAVVADNYMPTFWTTFWADQLWRAYVYCDLMRQKQYTEAKKAQYKLPFSFINRDWSRYNVDELSAAHEFLTILDFKLKNGASEIGLEHFYAQFFENKFQ